MYKKIILIIGFIATLSANDSYYKNGKLVELKNLHTARSLNNLDINYFKTEYGQKVGITDEILMQCKDGVNCRKVLKDFNIIDYTNLTDKIYVIKIHDYDTVFSLSRKLFESGNVEYAHPNFIKKRTKR